MSVSSRSFDLVLSSHLLFSYGALIDEDFHRCALPELVRVARWQVRLFPVVPHTSGERYGALDRLREWLEGRDRAFGLDPVRWRRLEAGT
ncbi:hypothetical protein [Nocardiopsis dassonvillei]|uniref:hypothetical protein n=1 Tax=Nocardiopsis dassonvillei TaxID=2014 RepID=UPI00362E2883